MMERHDVRVLTTTIDVPVGEAYEFARHPEHFPQWAAGLSTSLHDTPDGWVADTPAGKARIRFSDANAFGVLDHWVGVAGQPEVYIPLRMLAHGAGTEVELVLFRPPGMDDAAFARDAAQVEQDLAALKRVLEARR